MAVYLRKVAKAGAVASPKETADKSEDTPKTEETSKPEEKEAVKETTVQDTPAAATEEAEEGSKPVVFVLGASGKIGSATSKGLSEKFGDVVEIRAGVRNPHNAGKLKGMSNVTVVLASMADKTGLISTLHGVSALLIVSPQSENRVELVVSSVDAAKEAGVKLLAVVRVPMAGMDTIFARHFKETEDKV